MFGCMVYFMPAPTRDERDKAAPTLRPGIFVGYRTPPGGLAGGYLVIDLDELCELPLHAKTEPRIYCRPQITRTVKWKKHGMYFP